VNQDQSESDELESAFALISDFKAGKCASGSEISVSDADLLKRLRADLLPNDAGLDADLARLIGRVAEEDTRWNRRAMETIDAIYRLRSQDKDDEASMLSQQFLDECPSMWYRQIVGAA
jgi:hypothetical protein